MAMNPQQPMTPAPPVAAAAEAGNAAQIDRPPFDITQANVALANTYRLEFGKQLLTIATAVFAFTVSLFPTQQLASTTNHGPVWVAWLGWAFLVLSIGCGLAVLRKWERFYMSYRDYDNRGKRAAGEALRDTIKESRKQLDFVQLFGLAAGSVCVAVFASFRLGG